MRSRITNLRSIAKANRVFGVGQWDFLGDVVSTVTSGPIGNMLLQLGTQVASTEIAHALGPSPASGGVTHQQTQPVLPGTVPNAQPVYNVFLSGTSGTVLGAGGGSAAPGAQSVGGWAGLDSTTQIAVAGAGALLLYALLRK